jgi:S1-C subfamily serine protease
MKPIVFIAGTAFAAHAAFAADAPAQAAASASAAPVTATAAAGASASVPPEEARKELAELREQMQELSRKMAKLSSAVGEGSPRSYAWRYIGDPGRAMIGVVLASDPKGVRLSAVTPDGPAARAGLRDGDIVVAIDKDAVADKTPGAALEHARERLGNLKENQSVSIEYLRGAQKGTVVFAAERREAWNWPQMMSEDPEHPFLPKDFNERIQSEVARAQREAARMNSKDVRQAVEMARKETAKAMREGHTAMRLAMPWWGLNLAPLNADLGRYFGADKGVLVIAADEDSLPGIKGGDVITSIAGENVNRPEDALRVLRDQDSGKDVPIKVLRDRKTLALNMKAPEFNSIFNMRVPPPTPPTPPAAPAPPAPPAAHVPAPPAAPAAPPTPPPEPPVLAGASDDD